MPLHPDYGGKRPGVDGEEGWWIEKPGYFALGAIQYPDIVCEESGPRISHHCRWMCAGTFSRLLMKDTVRCVD